MEWPEGGGDVLDEVMFNKEASIVDFNCLIELANSSDKGSEQLADLVKCWEYRQANAVRLLREVLDNLSKQHQEVELKKLEILEDHRVEKAEMDGDKCPISRLEIDGENDSVGYWKKRAMDLEKLLEASVGREKVLMEKLQESVENVERQSSPVEELSKLLKRDDNFLHFILQNAPVTMGHQDKELRYRFIYNHFPGLGKEDVIGKTDVEIFSGDGVKESQDFKREVMERGLPAKREITFGTELFGSKTFLIYAEPVFSKAGETIGVNYMGMDVTDQVRKREKMGKLREEMAVQTAEETELNKTIDLIL